MHESSGPQFFRTTTGIQSAPDAFHESRLVDFYSNLESYMEFMECFAKIVNTKKLLLTICSRDIKLLG